MTRCRLCTSNDREAFINHMAGEMWETRRHGTLDDFPWERAPRYWRQTFRELAEAALDALEKA